MSRSGILLVDKPQDFTSFDVVAKARGLLQTRKIGHGGTLDPMATGVLPLFVGAATKAVDLLPDQDKAYTATFRLGITTDSQDITGTVLEERPVTSGREDVERALEKFLGKGEQLPPMYSAVRVGGKRLYELARKGQEVDRQPRPIDITELRLLGTDEQVYEYTIHVACSKGTYVRSLCHDLGQQLGCGAVLTALRRTRACGFSLEECITLQQAQTLREQDKLTERMLPLDRAFEGLPAFTLPPQQARLFQNGVRLSLDRLAGLPQGEGDLRIYGPEGDFLALATPYRETGLLHCKKMFAARYSDRT